MRSELISIATRRNSISFKKLEGTREGDGNSFDTYLSALLQVFADEQLIHKSLRDYFVLIDSASSPSEMLFVCHLGHGDIGTVLEVIAAQFILSVSSDRAFQCFLDRLFWHHDKEFWTPEMSMTASLSLLLNPIMLSTPKMFQPYLILEVSDTVGIGMLSEDLKPDLRIMDCYLTAFERQFGALSSNSGCIKTLQDVPLHKKYDFLVQLVGCFQQFNIRLPVQKFMSDVMKTHSMGHEESKWMLLQFSGLLSLSYVVGIDF